MGIELVIQTYIFRSSHIFHFLVFLYTGSNSCSEFTMAVCILHTMSCCAVMYLCMWPSECVNTCISDVAYVAGTLFSSSPSVWLQNIAGLFLLISTRAQRAGGVGWISMGLEGGWGSKPISTSNDLRHTFWFLLVFSSLCHCICSLVLLLLTNYSVSL